LPAGAFLITTAIFLPFCLLGVDPNHDGLWLKPGLDVYSAQTLFKDTFSQYGFLTTYLQVGFLWVFGARLLAIKVGTVLMYGVASAFLVAAWRKILPLPLAILAYVFWLLLPYFYGHDSLYIFHPWSSVYSLTFQAISLFCLLQSLQAARPARWAGLCGIAAALAYWCRFPVGTLLSASLLASYVVVSVVQREPVWKSPRLWAFIAMSAAVHLCFLGIISYQGSWHQWIYQNYVYPYNNVIVGTMRRRLWGVISSLFLLYRLFPKAVETYPHFRMSEAIKAVVELGGGLLVLFCLCLRFLPVAPVAEEESPARSRFNALLVSVLTFLAAAALAILCWNTLTWTYFWGFIIPVVTLVATGAVFVNWLRRRQATEGALALLPGFVCGLVSLASWMQYYPVYDHRHVFWAVAPGIGAFLFYVLRLARGRVLPLTIALGTLLVPLAVYKVELGRKNLAAGYVRFDESPVLRGMSIPVEEQDQWASVLAALARYNREHPDTTMVIYGIKAMYATLVPNLTNAHPYYIYFQSHPLPPGLFARREEFIRKFKPLVLAEDWRVTVNGREVSRGDSIHEDGFEYQKNNMIRNFGYRELVKIGETGDVILQPGR